MTKKYKVTLTAEERAQLKDILNKGKHGARKRKRAQSLLLADEQMTDEEIAERAGMHRRGVEELRQRFVEEGFEATLEGKPHGHRARAIQGEDEARLIVLACSPVPEGYDHWTLRLLQERWVTLEGKRVSYETIRQTLKKNELKPWQKREWCIPPEGNAEFVAGMEDILDVYTRPEDARYPLVCMDECPKQLIGETRIPLPAEGGETERFDTEYVRNGTCEIFMFNAPLLGWRRAEVTEHRTREDWAAQTKKLVEEDFPLAEKIILVMDNLNTHSIASLYETFEAEEARRIRDRLEIHHTPKHGSWLNMAEIELSVLNNHGLKDRIPTIEEMRKEVSAWNQIRNEKARRIDWRFTTADARIKLKRLYPHFNS